MSVLGVVGAAVGGFFGGPQGAMLGYSLGSGVDALVNPQKIEGPRLEDLEVQMASYGSPIPREWGVNRHVGTIIWPKYLELKESEHTESAKGGPEMTSYSYSCSLAVLLCEGPIKGVRRIWANKKLIYDITEGNEGATKDPAISGLRFYLGTEDQQPDPLIEAADGPSPAYLGYAYVVFEDLDLTDYGNRPPQFEFEVITKGAASQQPPVRLGNGGMTLLYTNPSTEEKTLWSVQDSNVYVYSLPGEELIQTIALPAPGYSITAIVGEIWIGHSNSGEDAYPYGATPINPVTYALGASANFGYQGAIGKLGTVVANGQVIYAFVNNGVGSGAIMYPTNTTSSITVPDWVFFSLEMPEAFKAALAGYGPWLTIANFATDQTDATIENPDWRFNAAGHRMAFDAARNCLYWACVDEPNVYKVDLAVYTLEKLVTVANVQGMHYNSADDTIYVDSQEGRLLAYSPETGAATGEIAGAGALVGQARGNTIDVGATDHYYASEAGSLWRINLNGALAPARIPLSQIVSDICTMKDGLSPSSIDVTALTPLVDGYILGKQMSRRAAAEALQPIYGFDAVENDNKVQFVMRGGAVAAVITEEDRAARDFGSDLPDSLSITRAQDLELPVEVELEYPDVDADHLVGAQYSRRITKDTQHKVNMQTAVVMGATKAKAVTEVSLYEAWLQTSFKWTTTRKFSHLLPTDVVELQTKAATYRARITMKREQPNGVIEWEGRQEAVEVYTLTGTGAAPTNYVRQALYAPGTTSLQLLDVPMLRDADNNGGAYVAMAGAADSWGGAQLFKSSDGGSTYEAVLTQSNEAAIGTTQSALSAFGEGNIFDEGGSVTVFMSSGQPLTSVSADQVLNGSNLAVIGAPGRWEVVQFKNAILIAPNTYQLSGFLRGRRGTEWATGTHEAGDAFILANVSTWARLDAEDLGLPRLYKAPPYRTALSASSPQSFTNTAVSLKPFAPVNLSGARDESGSLTLSWLRRTRLKSDTLHLPTPLGEASEAYSVDIIKNGAVVRTLTSSTPSVIYSAADQTADGIAPGAAVSVAIYQLSATVGRGYPLEGTV